MIFYKKLGFSLFIFVIILGVTAQAYAFSNTSTHIGLRAGVSDYYFDNDDVGSSSGLAGLTGGARKGPFELELSMDYTKVKQTLVRIEGFGIIPILYVGQIVIIKMDQTMLRLMLSGKYHFLGEDSALDPYLGFGGGGYIPIKNNSDRSNYEYKDILGVQFSAGTDIRFNPTLSSGFEFRYLLLRSDFVIDNGETQTVDFTRIKVLEYGISLKYHFPN